MLVIDMAGKLQREQANVELSAENEQSLMLRALMEVNFPKFIDSDLMLFKQILSDLFPNTLPSNAEDFAMSESVKYNCRNRLQLQPTQNFVQKAMQLHQIM